MVEVRASSRCVSPLIPWWSTKPLTMTTCNTHTAATLLAFQGGGLIHRADWSGKTDSQAKSATAIIKKKKKKIDKNKEKKRKEKKRGIKDGEERRSHGREEVAMATVCRLPGRRCEALAWTTPCQAAPRACACVCVFECACEHVHA